MHDPVAIANFRTKLTLTVEDLPKFSLSSSIVIRGTVTRQPPSDTPIILTIAGGAETVFRLVSGGVHWGLLTHHTRMCCGARHAGSAPPILSQLPGHVRHS